MIRTLVGMAMVVAAALAACSNGSPDMANISSGESQGCMTNADCEKGTVCEFEGPGCGGEMVCMPGCHTNDDCPGGALCNQPMCFTCPCPGWCDAGPKCEDPADYRHCNVDLDCVCGVNQVSGECDFGSGECIDTATECPDFCSGIAGHLKIICKDNVCTQVAR